MKLKIINLVIIIMLLLSFRVFAINFIPDDTYNSVVVVYTNTGVGSGFSIKENIILTNAHVVDNNKNVTLNLYDGTMIDGTVIKIDAEKDLALIGIDKAIAPLSINTEKLNIGQEVYAIGAPKDMPYTMTKGIISALDRKLGQNTYIQIDASVNSGNSGGPLVDENGKVIGIITLKASDAEGIGFAVNTDVINAFIENEVYSSSQETQKENDIENSNTSSTDNLDQIKKLITENDILKITVCISILANVILLLLYLLLLFKPKPKNKKDEFDFEIEIEE